MSMTTALIVIALLAWALQIFLSGLQVYRFNKAFMSLKQGTYLGVGRSKRKWPQPRVIIALSFDENRSVIDSLIMKGVTVFSLPQKIDSLHGIKLSEIDPMRIFPSDTRSREALSVALHEK